MKKFTILLALLAFFIPAFSQSEGDPNRLFLKNTIGNTTGYVLDRVSEISFAKVDGEVKANAEIYAVECDMLKLSVMRTEACNGFKIDIIPANIANVYDDLTVITYIDRGNPGVYYEDFTNAELTGIDLKPGTDYVLITIGIDGYGIEDGVVRVPFTTPKPALIGNPEITAEIVDRQLDSFSVKFTPNDDVSSYYCVAGEKGVMMSQFEFFGPMMQLSSFTDLIMKWGLERQGETIAEWKDMAPNTDFEVFYVALDANGTPADYKVMEVSTLALGGDGESKVDIEILEYEYAEWNGEMKPSQYIGFTPNDQTSCYRIGVYKAGNYDSNRDEILKELKTDPSMPTAYWFFYDPLVTDYQIDPNTEVVAIAAGKNGNGEWGEVTEVRFTTPEKAEGNPEMSEKPVSGTSDIKTRLICKKQTNAINHTPGKIPALHKTNKIQLR